MDNATAIAKIEAAETPYDLFGQLDGTYTEQLDQARAIYRELAKLTHPDTGNGDGPAFARLTTLWEQARDLIDTGSYRDGGLAGVTIRTKKGTTWIVGGKVATGDIADLHRCGKGVIKVARHPRDNDLLNAEALAIRHIRREAEDEYEIYLPEVADSLVVRDAHHRHRAANVFAPLPAMNAVDADKWVSLARIHELVPSLDPKDAAWIWRRILSALAISHKAKVVHHAVFPEHVMILPPEHGVVLVDWCYSRRLFKEKPIAIVPKYRDWYPEEVMNKENSKMETDITIAAKTLIFMLGGDPVSGKCPRSVPAPMRSHFQACTLERAFMRPRHAASILKSFDEIIWRLWGKNTFHEFVLPTF